MAFLCLTLDILLAVFAGASYVCSIILTLHVYIYLLSNPSSIFISGVTEEHTGCIGTDLVLVWCILSLTNGYWSCRGMPGHGIPDIGMLMVAADWVLGVVSPLLGRALL